MSVEEGSYTVALSINSAEMAPWEERRRSVAVIYGTPNAIALITKLSENKALDTELAKSIGGAFRRLKNFYPGWTYTVLQIEANKPIKEDFRRKLQTWMRDTATTFYLYGHGGPAGDLPAVAQWGSINFWANDNFPAGSALAKDTAKNPLLHFIVSRIVNRRYNFAFVDTCGSGGGNADGTVGSDDLSWARAFRAGEGDMESAFVGWNGAMGFNSFTDRTPSNWLRWRQRFWNEIANGAYVSRAVRRADLTTPPPSSNVNPWDTNRRVQLGDTTLP